MYSGWIRIFLGEHDTAVRHFAQSMRMSPLDPLIVVAQRVPRSLTFWQISTTKLRIGLNEDSGAIRTTSSLTLFARAQGRSQGGGRMLGR
jgi:hypothetical protein